MLNVFINEIPEEVLESQPFLSDSTDPPPSPVAAYCSLSVQFRDIPSY